ncbi:hypothetical protein AMECASPLE_030242, partial [Ameca splendens]
MALFEKANDCAGDVTGSTPLPFSWLCRSSWLLYLRPHCHSRLPVSLAEIFYE